MNNQFQIFRRVSDELTLVEAIVPTSFSIFAEELMTVRIANVESR